ncbi:poly-gamma-glutamate hydrolase family protein [Roseicyclus sp. F158]|uniref:Poly-gamma-glutamate hydrolase family protein n=1 Tax=Tropicimonas omnivorans TaxID=3075590 RepID=A0ABU3DHJ9_9RHOB|nr:poly-gamma-glutamate hydrolase family protein [Roseicyclus sp. F158]MDT0683166.1 poly-gamma-glutamate hydrolase family protein [Roseicyclus sp. F158]
MADRFTTFADLKAAAEAGVDYRIRLDDRGSPAVILAPHGGTIEPETAELAEAIAGDDLSFYLFEALKPGAHGDFHLTSHRYDEPRALDLVGRSERAVALHGRRDDGTNTVWLGGRDAALRDAIGTALETSGFDAARNDRLPGEHPDNICNRTRSGRGVQLELPRSLRHVLADEAETARTFCTAIRKALGAV